MSSKMTTEERRRLTAYRKLSDIENWRETLESLRNWSRSNAVACAAQNNPVGASYYNGKADGIEELIEKVYKSKKLHRDDDAAQER